LAEKKSIFCNPSGIRALVVQQASGAGLILANGPADEEDLLTEHYSFSSTTVVAKSAEDIKAYIKNTRRVFETALYSFIALINIFNCNCIIKYLLGLARISILLTEFIAHNKYFS
jgi:hypothetical protein